MMLLDWVDDHRAARNRDPVGCSGPCGAGGAGNGSSPRRGREPRCRAGLSG